jgi:hypothetical protein
MSFTDDDDEMLDEKPPTYDEGKILSADEVPLAEMCLEIENVDESSNISDETTVCLDSLRKASRLDQLISPIPPCKEYDDLKSPLTFSDCGYSSHGSPSSVQDHELGINNDINEDFNFFELFPSLA